MVFKGSISLMNTGCINRKRQDPPSEILFQGMADYLKRELEDCGTQVVEPLSGNTFPRFRWWYRVHKGVSFPKGLTCKQTNKKCTKEPRRLLGGRGEDLMSERERFD